MTGQTPPQRDVSGYLGPGFHMKFYALMADSDQTIAVGPFGDHDAAVKWGLTKEATSAATYVSAVIAMSRHAWEAEHEEER